MALCANCRRLKLSEILAQSVPKYSSSLPEGWIHSDTFASLRSSATSCPLCALLVGAVDAGDTSHVQESDCVKLGVYTRDQWPRGKGGQGGLGVMIAGLELKIGPRGQNVLHSIKHVPMWADEDGPEGLKQLVMLRPKSSAPNIPLLRQWHNTCLHNHIGCRIPAPTLDLAADEDPVPLPARLVDLSTPKGSADLRLIETHGEEGRYAALSHCWGTTPIATTTKQTLGRHTERIELNDLSANFRDAIDVARALRFRYLWIDSLCIVQDDDADWEAQSARMAEIYTNASLTIAAANSSTATEGFLKPRRPRKTAVVPLSEGPGAVLGDCTFGEATAELYQDDFRRDVEGGPLARRGWTLQERLLSRRTVFFGPEELHWECRSTRWSESTHMRPIRYVDISAGLAAFHGVPVFPPRGAVDKSRLLDDWYLVLGEFTKRFLTAKADKLPALSGIAKVVHRAFGSDDFTSYRAGLWSHDMPRALLWSSFGPWPGGERTLPGPSWSWISRDARIFLARHEAKAVDDISDVKWDVKLSGIDPYGRVESSTVSFRGRIKRVPEMRLITPAPKQTGAPYPLSNALLYDSQSQQIGAAVLDDPSDESAFNRALYAVPLRHVLGAAGNITKIECLLLLERLPGIYRRVGVADMAGSNANDAHCKGAPFAEPFLVFFYDATKTEMCIS